MRKYIVYVRLDGVIEYHCTLIFSLQISHLSAELDTSCSFIDADLAFPSVRSGILLGFWKVKT